jgi:hypothetical protein
LWKRGEDRRERHVDPDVDRPEGGLDAGGGGVELVEVRDVHRDGECFTAGVLDVRGGGVEPGLSAGDQRDLGATRGEGDGGGPADPSAGAGHDHHPGIGDGRVVSAGHGWAS